MRNSMEKWVRFFKYRQEATIICLSLLSTASTLCTVIMCFFNLNKAILLLLISVVLIGILLYYRMHHHVHLRSSITTLRHVRATRRKRAYRRQNS